VLLPLLNKFPMLDVLFGTGIIRNVFNALIIGFLTMEFVSPYLISANLLIKLELVFLAMLDTIYQMENASLLLLDKFLMLDVPLGTGKIKNA